MRPHVPGDHIAAASGVRARSAAVRLLAGVRALVGGEVVGPGEHLRAHLALVRLETAVQARVARQHVRAREPAEAALALELPLRVRGAGAGAVPRRYVLCQSIAHCERLPTHAARKRLFFPNHMRLRLLRFLREIERHFLSFSFAELRFASKKRLMEFSDREPVRSFVVIIVADLHVEAVQNAGQAVLLEKVTRAFRS